MTTRYAFVGLVGLALAASSTLAQANTAGGDVAPNVIQQDDADQPALVAIVLEMTGRGEVRLDAPSPDQGDPAGPSPWRAIERGMELPHGATIRTGARSSVTLRVGLNATVRVNSFARTKIGELAKEQTGEATTLRTTMVLERGDLDVRVDHIGNAANDFAIVTQAATLAVRGTNFSVGIDGLSGLRVQGAQTNSFRAIEVQYLEEEEATALSQGRIDAAWRHPALAALATTFDRPNRGVGATDYLSRIGTPVSQLVSSRQVSSDQITGGREIEVRIVTAGQVLEGIGSGKDGPPPQGESINRPR